MECKEVLYTMQREMVLNEGAWEFKRPRWFGGIAEWLWQKLSRPTMTASYRRATVNHDNIIQAITTSRRGLSVFTDEQIKHVVCSPEIAFGIEKQAIRSAFHMDVRVADAGRFKVYGLTVHVIPWFDGIVLLPDLRTAK